MSRKSCMMLVAVLTMVLASGLYFSEADAKKAAPAEKPVKPQDCYGCHATIKDLHANGKHAKVNCTNCHSGIEKHLHAPGPEARPTTDTSWQACGKCHRVQMESFMEASYLRPARDEKSQVSNRAPNPFWDKLMMGHGFTKEHNLTRSHVFMLTDHLTVDRAYGGRFQPKGGWTYIFEKGKAWDILMDKFPENKDHKVFLPQTAAAANPVCLQCKTQDQILDWAFMGEPGNGVKWSRVSKVNDFAKDLNHSLNCFTCHDPHASKPRIVRDGLIEALTRPEADTLWHKDPKRTKIQVIDMGLRGYNRKIAILEKYDTRLLCGQCHVEYNCNPGTDTKTGKPVTMADKRTNHFPYKDVFGLYDHYVNQINFLDFRHTLTGGLLWKAQHPEAESFYNSKHAKAGVGCNGCHTPKVKEKNGGSHTIHFAVTPRVNLKDTCLQCHSRWTEEQARYAIDSVKAYTRGKLRKAEFWLSELIDKIVDAKKAGVPEEVVKQAQEHHLKAHILWEYWTAENSDGFHNPEMAKESLTKSMDESQKGIKLLTDTMNAMAPKTASAK